ncbi:tRNA 2-thiocytidine biosynthesis TtcA family protein [Clostridium sp. D33t1_170424_F3]|uniref:tRNA 2-thiocytidine biosynthesis TtcA family protein n=1 Tax=Clostridium sp. D33t1_170424_F3 TaxID=2787099 RepID=UPI0018AB5792|nr:tRNA 2-thiocytidine biosynthesis TtcA family protein [Clostridium sp. D33t1_170424_F3]
MQKILGEMRAAMERYEMIAPGDRVAVGVSGGKDSLVLLTALAKLRAFYPQPFEVVALTVDPCFGGVQTDYTPVESLCRELDVEYRLRRSRLGEIIFEERKESNPCSLCARMRRGILHNMAKEAGCNKLALGHHFDDAVQTFYMNLFYGGKLGCFSPKSYLSRKDLWLIRPLVFTEESAVRSAARRHALPVVKSACPVDGATSRQDTAGLIAELEKQFPDLRAKTMGALQRAHLDNW